MLKSCRHIPTGLRFVDTYINVLVIPDVIYNGVSAHVEHAIFLRYCVQLILKVGKILGRSRVLRFQNGMQHCKLTCFLWVVFPTPPSRSTYNQHINKVVRRLTTEIRSEKCVVRRFRRCANVVDCAYTNLDSIAYYTPRLYIAYCS